VDRLAQQIGFLVEIDGLKEVLRRSYRIIGSALENSAEHKLALGVGGDGVA
jgi:putative hydrolase of HD superfamily